MLSNYNLHISDKSFENRAKLEKNIDEIDNEIFIFKYKSKCSDDESKTIGVYSNWINNSNLITDISYFSSENENKFSEVILKNIDIVKKGSVIFKDSDKVNKLLEIYILFGDDLSINNFALNFHGNELTLQQKTSGDNRLFLMYSRIQNFDNQIISDNWDNEKLLLFNTMPLPSGSNTISVQNEKPFKFKLCENPLKSSEFNKYISTIPFCYCASSILQSYRVSMNLINQKLNVEVPFNDYSNVVKIDLGINYYKLYPEIGKKQTGCLIDSNNINLQSISSFLTNIINLELFNFKSYYSEDELFELNTFRRATVPVGRYVKKESECNLTLKLAIDSEIV